MSAKFIPVSQIVEANGKTVRENNLERKHAFSFGELVEIIADEESVELGYAGLHLRVTEQTRDCDGTPYYSLGICPRDPDLHGKAWAHGVPEYWLRKVES